jgi:hypothetical protein
LTISEVHNPSMINGVVLLAQICILVLILYMVVLYQDLVEIYSVSAETMINDVFSYSENV